VNSTNSLALYNAPASMTSTNAFGAKPITLVGGALTNLGSLLTLSATTPVNFGLGTIPATVVVAGGLTLNSTLNISDGGGFGAGTYTLFSYNTGFGLSGTPVLGTKPAGYNYSLDTSTAGQVNLIVTSTNGTAPTITNSPVARGVPASSNATFTVGASGTAPLSYQWWFNTTNSVGGGTNSSLTITNVQPAKVGGYSVSVTNAYGAVTSSPAALTIILPPTFTTTSDSSSNSVISGTGGVTNGTYYVLASTNIALPLNQWTPIATNQFDASGDFIFTNPMSTNVLQRFFRLQIP
jgi:hypothetical protein